MANYIHQKDSAQFLSEGLQLHSKIEAWRMQKIREKLVVPHDRIYPYLLWHATIGHNENLDVLQELFKTRDVNEIELLIKLPKDREYAPEESQSTSTAYL